jgi:CRP/FNR family cyclic AMP-dependent transcriptional regulator
LGKKEHLNLLEVVPLFHGLSTKEMGRLAKVTDEVTIGAGSVIAEEGEPGDAFYLIVDGSAAVKRKGKKIATLGTGDFFGEMSLLDEGMRSASVELIRDSTLLVIHGTDFAVIVNEMPGVATKLLRGLAARLRAADHRIV